MAICLQFVRIDSLISSSVSVDFAKRTSRRCCFRFEYSLFINGNTFSGENRSVVLIYGRYLLPPKHHVIKRKYAVLRTIPFTSCRFRNRIKKHPCIISESPCLKYWRSGVSARLVLFVSKVASETPKASHLYIKLYTE